MPKPSIDYKKCTSCFTCIDVCPMEVYVKEKDKKGKEVPVVKKPEECIGCKACEVQCSAGAIKVKE